MTRLRIDADQIRAFASSVFRYASDGQIVSLRILPDGGGKEKALRIHPIQINGGGLEGLITAAIEHAQWAADHPSRAVFCPPIAGFAGMSKADEVSLSGGYALSVECDQRAYEARQMLEQLLGSATVVVRSGGQWTDPNTGEVQDKLHLHWRLTEPATGEDLGKLKDARRLAAEFVGADTSNVSVVHPIRWPGSWHRKAEPRLASIVSLTESEIDLADALERLQAAAPVGSEKPSARAGRTNGKGPFGFDTLSADDALDVAAALACIPNTDLPWDEWNRIGMATWAATQGKGFAAFDAWSQRSAKYEAQATRARWDHYASSPPDRIGAGTLFHLAAQARPGWRKPSEARASNEDQPSGPEAAAPASPSSSERPVIRILAGELPRMVDEAEAALIAAGTPIFVRAGVLVRPVTEQAPAAHGRSTTVAKLKSYCRDGLTDVLSKVAEFQQLRKNAWVRADPPNQVGSILLAREGSWNLPRVAGVITTPTLRADGSVLVASGYDPATRLYLARDDGLQMPELDERPSQEDAVAALRLLSELLAEFPFVGPIDRAVALSGLITAVTRGGVPVAPLHAFRASTPGTGKSLLVDVAATIATGRPCPVIAAGKTAEETEKRLGALLRDGVPIISIDNVEGELGGDMLCQVTERPLVRIRILGLSEAPEFECKGAVFATGNGLTLLGDMTRRAVLCSLDAGVERPELRRFAFDPIARVLKNRGAYVAAALTIARAYRVAGEPEVCPPIGSYTDWSRTVRAPLVWLGEADPVASMETARKEDPELSSIRELFGHWRETLGLDTPCTTNEVIRVACEKMSAVPFEKPGEFRRPEFRDLLLRIAGDGGAVSSRRLGKWLSRISGRIVVKHRLVMKADSSHGNRFTLRMQEDAREAIF